MKLPPPPRRPDREECCGRGCCPCIYDYYDTALEKWRSRAEALGINPDAILAARNAAQIT